MKASRNGRLGARVRQRWGLGMTIWMLLAGAIAAQDVSDDWRYVLRRPGDGWTRPDFNDADWLLGSGGFGTFDTPGARIGTNWSTNDIWLRKRFELAAAPARPALLIHHDEDAAVYLNGRLIATFSGYVTEYEVVPIAEEHRAAIRSGSNLLAVHCRQTGGGQFIDVHLIDADRPPKLPPPKRNTKPFQSDLITRWGREVTADNAWTEYPRPQLQRASWQNLNGRWDYAITPAGQREPPSEWQQSILVPFCLESKLGGVQRMLEPIEALWYRRTFRVEQPAEPRTLLNFEAVDYDCRVFVNGQAVGEHRGGNTPFSLDVTAALRSGENELLVRVEDETEGWQLRGKQTLNPRGIWYTQVSGIWQTVWLETVPAARIDDLTITTDADANTITVTAAVIGAAGRTVAITAHDGAQTVAEGRGEVGAPGTATVALRIADAKLWSPSSPHLYDLTVRLLDEQGQAVDQVQSYAGIRTVGRVRDAAGHWRFTLNGQPIFHWGPLDQGWWPDGLLTPPSDAAMKSDIEFLKAAGFNMIRKHIKVEPRRYYYHCDRLGVMLWQDQVSGGRNPPWTRLNPQPTDAAWPDEHHQQFLLELERMIDNLESHPSIVVWVPFNEAWGQHRTVEVGQWVMQRDPSRLVNIASGGNFWPVGHVVDEHRYPHPGYPFDPPRDADFVKVMGEFGGHGFPRPGHLWDAQRRNWGYGDLPKSEAEYKERYAESLRLLNELRRQGISAGVYTQTTDVEGEINGLLTYDREIAKIPAEELARLHQVLFTD